MVEFAIKMPFTEVCGITGTKECQCGKTIEGIFYPKYAHFHKYLYYSKYRKGVVESWGRPQNGYLN